MTVGRVAFVALSWLHCVAVLSDKPPTRGFTLNLIHRDSLNSPSSNPNDDSRFAHIKSAITRSTARANRISTFRHGMNAASDLKTNVITESGEYLMNVSLGTPPFSILAVADMHTDFIWTQCKPCTKCYKQNTPLFDPTKSSTYKRVSCSAPECTTRAADFDPICDSSKKCQVSYIDDYSTTGVIATETLTLGSKIPKILFGCGFDNQDIFNKVGSGIIGLGIGRESLIGQMSKTIGGKFSYCLVPLSSKGTKSSQINFGKNAVVSGQGVVSTPLVTKEPNIYYWLKIKAITIGNVRIPFPDPLYPGDDNIANTIIDSSTTLLTLPSGFYFKLDAEIIKQVRAKPVERDESPYLCYDSASFKAPEIVMNFDGADVKLNYFNAFVEVEDGVICFASESYCNSMAIYGNLAQRNFLVGFDKKSVSFKHADCSSYSKYGV